MTPLLTFRCTVVVREDFSRSRCDSLVCDIRAVSENLQKMDAGRIDEHVDAGKARRTRGNRGRHARHHYNNASKHNLSGKHGKTHAIC